MPKIRLTRINYALAAGVGVLASIAIIVRFAQSERRVPARCPSGLEAQEARCCGLSQGLASNGQCAGIATACATDMARDDSGACVLPAARIHLAGGTARFGAADWEGPAEPVQELTVGPFDLDRGEVSVDRFRECSSAAQCPKIAEDSEPGRPVRNVSPEEAARFCAFAGGRLPTSEEWLFAATGSDGRRYPWGNTGLVCRRATFGLVVGPCARAGSGPDFVGARPDGATPEGVQDLAGNVAEWTIERDGSFVARGGSYRSEAAGDLKAWAFEPRQTRAAHVGFRCAYSEASANSGGEGK
ncbi:MAG: SUMF1/EgtB/PvdO family nonheme iron enzyme [Polyangiaceae bacterium]